MVGAYVQSETRASNSCGEAGTPNRLSGDPARVEPDARGRLPRPEEQVENESYRYERHHDPRQLVGEIEQ